MNNANAAELPETKPMTWHARFQQNQCGCPLCGKPLTSHHGGLFIHVGEGGISIIRADLPSVEGREGVMLSTGYDTGDMGWFEIGSTCAKKLGAAYSKRFDTSAEGFLVDPTRELAQSLDLLAAR